MYYCIVLYCIGLITTVLRMIYKLNAYNIVAWLGGFFGWVVAGSARLDQLGVLGFYGAFWVLLSRDGQ
jgi:hypothetical protein